MAKQYKLYACLDAKHNHYSPRAANKCRKAEDNVKLQRQRKLLKQARVPTHQVTSDNLLTGDMINPRLHKLSQKKKVHFQVQTTDFLRAPPSSKIFKRTKKLIPIHSPTRNHWFFIKVTKSLMTVFDSLRKKKAGQYQGELAKALKRFPNRKLKVNQSFPQQNNDFDCGVYMLIGIEDILQGRQWTASCQSAREWRENQK